MLLESQGRECGACQWHVGAADRSAFKAGRIKGYDGGLFTFQDTEFTHEPNPVLLSRLVVIAPEATKLDAVKRNYDGEPKVETM